MPKPGKPQETGRLLSIMQRPAAQAKPAIVDATEKNLAESPMKKIAATPPKHNGVKGKAARAENNKDRKVQPSKQKMQRHRGR